MKKSIIIFSVIILSTIIGFFTNLYEYKTLAIIIFSIVIGGYVGSKLLNKKSS